MTVTATISRTRSAATTIPLSIPAKGDTASGTGHDLGVTAESGDHGTLASITIPANMRSGTGTITTAHDSDADDEVFLVELGDAPEPTSTSGRLPTRAWQHGSPSLVTVRIIDDEGPRRVSLGADDVREGENVGVSVTLLTVDGIEARLSRDLTIPLAFTNITAEAADYTSAASLTVTAGSTFGFVSIGTHHDTDADDETFTVSLGSPLPSGVSAGPVSSVQVRIRDDETPSPSPGTLSVDASPSCGSTVTVTTETPSFALVLTPAPSAEVSADYRVAHTTWGDWLPTTKIQTSGSSVFTSFGTFAQLQEAYPGFTGFQWRLNDHPNVTVRCSWTIQPGGV